MVRLRCLSMADANHMSESSSGVCGKIEVDSITIGCFLADAVYGTKGNCEGLMFGQRMRQQLRRVTDTSDGDVVTVERALVKQLVKLEEPQYSFYQYPNLAFDWAKAEPAMTAAMAKDKRTKLLGFFLKRHVSAHAEFLASPPSYVRSLAERVDAEMVKENIPYWLKERDLGDDTLALPLVLLVVLDDQTDVVKTPWRLFAYDRKQKELRPALFGMLNLGDTPDRYWARDCGANTSGCDLVRDAVGVGPSRGRSSLAAAGRQLISNKMTDLTRICSVVESPLSEGTMKSVSDTMDTTSALETTAEAEGAVENCLIDMEIPSSGTSSYVEPAGNGDSPMCSAVPSGPPPGFDNSHELNQPNFPSSNFAPAAPLSLESQIGNLLQTDGTALASQENGQRSDTKDGEHAPMRGRRWRQKQ